jgi:polyphosphate kinase
MVERVEVATPVRDPEHQQRLSEILELTLGHPERWELRPDGSYVRGSDVIAAAPAHAEAR